MLPKTSLFFCGVSAFILLFPCDSMGNCVCTKVTHLSTEYMQQIKCICNHHLNQYLKDKSTFFISCMSNLLIESLIAKSIFRISSSFSLKMVFGGIDFSSNSITMVLSLFLSRSSFEASVV